MGRGKERCTQRRPPKRCGGGQTKESDWIWNSRKSSCNSADVSFTSNLPGPTIEAKDAKSPIEFLNYFFFLEAFLMTCYTKATCMLISREQQKMIQAHGIQSPRMSYWPLLVQT